MNPITFLILLCILYGVGYWAFVRRKHIKLLEKYEHLIDDIYIVSNHPVDNRESFLPRFENEDKIIIVKVPYRDVFLEVKRQIDLLKESGNPFYMSPERIAELQLKGIPILTPEQAVEVKILIFQNGIRRCETWDEFEEYCEGVIMNEVQPRHEGMKEKDNEWYEVNYHKKPFQTVVN